MCIRDSSFSGFLWACPGRKMGWVIRRRHTARTARTPVRGPRPASAATHARRRPRRSPSASHPPRSGRGLHARRDALSGAHPARPATPISTRRRRLDSIPRLEPQSRLEPPTPGPRGPRGSCGPRRPATTRTDRAVVLATKRAGRPGGRPGDDSDRTYRDDSDRTYRDDSAAKADVSVGCGRAGPRHQSAGTACSGAGAGLRQEAGAHNGAVGALAAAGRSVGAGRANLGAARCAWSWSRDRRPAGIRRGTGT